jgi:ParB-like chromosome segregation protein Spo0J
LEVQIAENLQREDLTDFETAKLLKLLIENKGYTQDLLAKKLCKSQGWVSQRLKMLEFQDRENITPVIMDKMTERQARTIEQLPPEQKKQVIKEIKETSEVPRVVELEQKKELITASNHLIRKGDLVECEIGLHDAHKNNVVDVYGHTVCQAHKEIAEKRFKPQEIKTDLREPTKDTWAFREARMKQSPSKMEIDLLELLTNDPELTPIREHPKVALLVSEPDFELAKFNTMLYVDGEAVHANRQDKDERIREMVQQKGYRVLSLTYNSKTSAKDLHLQIRKTLLGDKSA